MKYPLKVNEFIEELEANRRTLAIDPKLKKELEFAKERKEYWTKKVSTLSNQVVLLCPHNSLVVNSTYIEGDYYNRAYTEYDVRCKDCGAWLYEHKDTHSYFG